MLVNCIYVDCFLLTKIFFSTNSRTFSTRPIRYLVPKSSAISCFRCHSSLCPLLWYLCSISKSSTLFRWLRKRSGYTNYTYDRIFLMWNWLEKENFNIILAFNVVLVKFLCVLFFFLIGKIKHKIEKWVISETVDCTIVTITLNIKTRPCFVFVAVQYCRYAFCCCFSWQIFFLV